MLARAENDLQLEKQADYRRFTLSGNHYEMGRRWARILTHQDSEPVTDEEVAEAAQLLGVSVEDLATLATTPGEVEEQVLSASQLSFALDCLQVVSNFHPALLDEFEGWADGLGVSMDSLLSTLSFGMKDRSPGGSAFAWQTGEAVIVGRNYDFSPRSRIRHLIRAEPVAYYATIGMNDGLLGGRHDGVNEEGLFVALNRVSAPEPKKPEPGVVSHLVPRILLETCANAGEAVMLVGEMPHLMSYSYIVADPDEMFVVEADPGSVRVREAEDGFVASTNHFLHPEMQSSTPSTLQVDSERRLSKITSALKEATADTDPWQLATGILTAHDAAICGHGDDWGTLWSMVADLTNRRLTYSLGAPCRNEYEEVPWPEKRC